MTGMRYSRLPIVRAACRQYATVQKQEIRLSNALKTRNSLEQLIRAFETDLQPHQQWLARLRWALASTEERSPRLRISVLGDFIGGARSIVDALVQDPFGPASANEAFKLRRHTVNRPLFLRHSENYKLDNQTLESPSPWLKQNDFELCEVPINTPREMQLTDEILDILYQSSSVMLCLSDVHTLADFYPVLTHLRHHPSVIITCNSLISPPHTAVTELREQLGFVLQNNSLEWPILPIQVKSARKALEICDGNNLVPFAEAFANAGLPLVSDEIAKSLQRSRIESEGLRLAVYTANQARQSAKDAIFAQEASTNAALSQLQVCQKHCDSLRGDAERALSFTASGSLDLPESESASGRHLVASVLSNRLAWWKLPLGRADDVYGDVAQASQGFHRNLENNLSFAAGRLAALTEASNSLLNTTLQQIRSDQRNNTLSSPILENKIAQLQSRSGPITADVLTEPIYSRRNILTAPGGPIEHLQLKAQQAVLKFYTLLSGSVGLGYAAAFSSQLQMNTALACGLLGGVFSVWDLQRSWLKAVKRFWQNYARVEEGLAVDLQSKAKAALDNQVFLRPNGMIEGLDTLAKRRLTELRDTTALIDSTAMEASALPTDRLVSEDDPVQSIQQTSAAASSAMSVPASPINSQSRI